MFKRSFLMLSVIIFGFVFLGGGGTFIGAGSTRLHVYLSADRIEVVTDWLRETELMTVRVMSPAGELVVDEKVCGSSYTWWIDASDPDGLYRYEVRVVANADESDVRQNRPPTRGVNRQPGMFTVKNGVILVPEQEEAGGDQSFWRGMGNGVEGLTRFTLNLLVSEAHALDVTAQSSEPSVFFDDTDLTGNYQWKIFTYPGSSGIDSVFSIYDEANSKHAVKIAESANHDSSLVVDSGGNLHFANDGMFFDRGSVRLGIGTTIPDQPLVIENSWPIIKLDDVGGGEAFLGFDAGIFSIAESDPAAPIFSIFTAAPVGSFLIDSSGRVGIGTSSPTEKLHVDGNIYVSGNMELGSSRQFKEDIRSLETQEAMEALKALRPVKFHYKKDPGEESVGFIAEEVPDLVATTSRKSLSPMDIVGVLTKVVQDQQKVSEEQRELVRKQQEIVQDQQNTICELKKRVADLEKKLQGESTLACIRVSGKVGW